jgi:hypothetical protein
MTRYQNTRAAALGIATLLFLFAGYNCSLNATCTTRGLTRQLHLAMYKSMAHERSPACVRACVRAFIPATYKCKTPPPSAASSIPRGGFLSSPNESTINQKQPSIVHVPPKIHYRVTIQVRQVEAAKKTQEEGQRTPISCPSSWPARP